MAKIKINKKDLYQQTLEDSILAENYESAAKIRDLLLTISDDELIEIDEDDEPSDIELV